MIKKAVTSQFSTYALIVLILLVLLCTSFTILMFVSMVPWYVFIVFFIFYLYGISVSILTLLVDTVKVKIKEYSINKVTFLGFGKKCEYELKEIVGFKLSNINARGGKREFLYLVKDDKKIISISELYHRNYAELKQAIIDCGIKNLGYEKFNLIRHLKEVYFSR